MFQQWQLSAIACILSYISYRIYRSTGCYVEAIKLVKAPSDLCHGTCFPKCFPRLFQHALQLKKALIISVRRRLASARLSIFRRAAPNVRNKLWFVGAWFVWEAQFALQYCKTGVYYRLIRNELRLVDETLRERVANDYRDDVASRLSQLTYDFS